MQQKASRPTALKSHRHLAFLEKTHAVVVAGRHERRLDVAALRQQGHFDEDIGNLGRVEIQRALGHFAFPVRLTRHHIVGEARDERAVSEHVRETAVQHDGRESRTFELGANAQELVEISRQLLDPRFGEHVPVVVDHRRRDAARYAEPFAATAGPVSLVRSEHALPRPCLADVGEDALVGQFGRIGVGVNAHEIGQRAGGDARFDVLFD